VKWILIAAGVLVLILAILMVRFFSNPDNWR
jgi:hypothetical protein